VAEHSSAELTSVLCSVIQVWYSCEQKFPAAMFHEGDSWNGFALAGIAIVTGAVVVVRKLRNPSRPFESTSTVGEEYDKWAKDGILEHYWGEHIHLGFYGESQRSWFDPHVSFASCFISATRAKMFVNSFKQTKFDFVSKLLNWSSVDSIEKPIQVLDVGCGIGGTSRYIAQQKPSWSVTGISISAQQISRASDLAISQSLNNVQFECCDAMKMPFPDNSFDVVWSCESAEHMPDKAEFLRECIRVLKPGGRFVLATWCQRDDSTIPFTHEEAARLDFLYKEWCHPRFASLEEYSSIASENGLCNIQTTDWTSETLPAWRHSIFVGIWSPWAVILKPSCWWSTIREIVTLERMHCAFRDGLMKYGILTGIKQ
jgi:MPBQ/MSBQ methyltransferase